MKTVLDDIEVSVCCVVYNQVNYVEEMLEGILMQKTDFKYEIIIHDDASTDGTVEILKRYKRKYSEIIRLILEKENQFSKGISIIRDIICPCVKGKYIGFCEGDDFWIFDRKIQRQYEFMESHPEVSLCYHNAFVYQEDMDKLSLNILNQPSGYIGDEDIICTTKGWYPTASFFYRTEYLARQPDLHPPTGDEGIRNYMACCGKLYFINRVWSVYRQFAQGSWNSKFDADIDVAQKYMADMVDYFIKYNEYSNRRFEPYLYERMKRSILYYIEIHCSKTYTVHQFWSYIEALKELTDHQADDFFDKLYMIERIRCRDYYQVTIEQTIKSLITSEKMLYIYGAGTEALKALVSLLKFGINVCGFIVTKRTYENELLGYPINEIKTMRFNEDMVIWPCLVKERDRIFDVLGERGCVNLIF